MSAIDTELGARAPYVTLPWVRNADGTNGPALGTGETSMQMPRTRLGRGNAPSDALLDKCTLPKENCGAFLTTHS